MEEITNNNDLNSKKSNKFKIIITIVITLLALGIATLAMHIAPNYQKEETEDMINLVINNKNVTAKMKNEVYINDDGIIYLSKSDVQNYFDKYIKYYEEDKRLVTTYEDKIAILEGNSKVMEVNGKLKDIKASIITKNDIMYIPFSEMCESVYNANLTYVPSTQTIIVDSTEREVQEVTTKKKVSIKYKAKVLSRTLEKVDKGEQLIYISTSEGWIKVRTQDGKIGYVKENSVSEIKTTREAKKTTNQIEGKINLVWDYYSEYAKAPNRTGETIEGVNVVSPAFFAIEKGTGHITENIGDEGKAYIDWAHENGYKVWAMFSNNSLRETTSTIISDFDKRQALIDNIVELVEIYDLDGLNLDFENLNLEDKSNYSRLVIELAPRLKALGKTFSVDVTAPDGSENWSLCFDRNVIGHVADYIVFMAYDQYGNGTKAGTTAGYNWVENNINKFLDQEVVKSEKIILGIPLYTRIWTISDDEAKDPSKTVDMKDVDSVIAGKGEKKWDDTLKQYYIEYNDGNNIRKMWIEDEKSIIAKIGLANKYKLAGIAFWEKDRETEGLWKIVDEELNK